VVAWSFSAAGKCVSVEEKKCGEKLASPSFTIAHIAAPYNYVVVIEDFDERWVGQG